MQPRAPDSAPVHLVFCGSGAFKVMGGTGIDQGYTSRLSPGWSALAFTVRKLFACLCLNASYDIIFELE